MELANVRSYKLCLLRNENSDLKNWRIQRHLYRLHFKAELTEKDFEVNNPG